MNEKDYQPAPPNPKRDELFRDVSMNTQKKECCRHHIEIMKKWPCTCICHQEKATIETTGFLHSHPVGEECTCFDMPYVTTTSATTKTGDWEDSLDELLTDFATGLGGRKKIHDLLRETHQQLLNQVIEMCEGMLPTRDSVVTVLIDRNLEDATPKSLIAIGYAQATVDLKSLLENKRDSLI